MVLPSPFEAKDERLYELEDQTHNSTIAESKMPQVLVPWGHLEFFQTPGGEGEWMAAHRVHGAWLVFAMSETETKSFPSIASTEFGVPTTSHPPRYSWRGAIGLATELSTGGTTSGGSGYVPQLGRALQTQGTVPPGAFPNGAYTGAPYTTQPASNPGSTNQSATGALAAQDAKQDAKPKPKNTKKKQKQHGALTTTYQKPHPNQTKEAWRKTWKKNGGIKKALLSKQAQRRRP